MANSESPKARNGYLVEELIFQLLTRLQTLSPKVYKVRGNGDYREVSDADFNIYYTEGVIRITTGNNVICSNHTYTLEDEENEYISQLAENFFSKLQKLLIEYKDMSVNNIGFVAVQ